jgi:hypothetical protein
LYGFIGKEKGIRLTRHAWFSAVDYTIMVAWIHQNLDQDDGVGLLNSGKVCSHFFTRAN